MLRNNKETYDLCFIIENKVDENMFCKLTRLDLKDLFPVDFLARKKFSDLLSNLQQEPDLVSYAAQHGCLIYFLL